MSFLESTTALTGAISALYVGLYKSIFMAKVKEELAAEGAPTDGEV
jgi:hypothetical protein